MRRRALASCSPWGVAQLDLLSKRMRREGRRARPAPGARRRAERRRERAEAGATDFWRRPPRPEAAVVAAHLAGGLAGRRGPAGGEAWRALDRELRRIGHLPGDAELDGRRRRGARETALDVRGILWRRLDSFDGGADQLATAAAGLRELGVLAPAEGLRRDVRDRLLLAGAPPAALEALRRPGVPGPYAPAAFDPAAPQLAGRDLKRRREPAGRRRDRAPGRGRRRAARAMGATP